MSNASSEILFDVLGVELFVLALADVADPLETVLNRDLGTVFLVDFGAGGTVQLVKRPN